MAPDQGIYDNVVWIAGQDIPPAPESPLSQVAEKMTPTGDTLARNSAAESPSMLAALEVELATDTDTLVVLAAWKDWLEAQYAPATIRSYWGSVMRFFTRHPHDIASITPEHIAEFLQNYPFRSSARRTSYQGLKSLFAWAEKRGVIEKNPMVTIIVPTVMEKVPRALSEDEFERVLKCAYARHPKRGAALKLLYHTGGRIGEILTLKWEDINDQRLILQGHKTGKEREIPMTPPLFAALRELHTYFGVNEYVLPRSSQTVWQWCRQAGRDAGVERVHPHLFRSTAATRMLVRGARPHAVREVLGHASIRTTQRYWAVEKEDMEKAVGLL